MFTFGIQSLCCEEAKKPMERPHGDVPAPVPSKVQAYTQYQRTSMGVSKPTGDSSSFFKSSQMMLILILITHLWIKYMLLLS
jgi:hypothetical protein